MQFYCCKSNYVYILFYPIISILCKNIAKAFQARGVFFKLTAGKSFLLKKINSSAISYQHSFSSLEKTPVWVVV